MEGQRLTDILNSDFSGHGNKIHAVFINRNNLMSQVTSLVPGKELVVIAGGDGTVSEMTGCLSMLESPPPFAVIPIGTGNDLARNTGWYRIWREGGIEAFFIALNLSRAESIDVWGIDDAQRFICYASVGLDARIISFIDSNRAAIPDFIKWKMVRRFMLRLLYCAAFGKYALSELFHGRNNKCVIEFYLKGSLIKSIDCARTEVVLITSLDSYAGGGHLSGTASRNDGIFEVYCFPSLLAYIRFLIKSRLGGKFIPEPDFKADNADFLAGTSVYLQTDGEPSMITPEHGACAISLKRAIPILIPPDDLAAREKIRRESPGKEGVKTGISTVMPGAAAGKSMEGRQFFQSFPEKRESQKSFSHDSE